MSTGKWLNNIGRICRKGEKKADGSYDHFLVFERNKDKNKQPIGENPFPITIKEGDFFQLRSKKDDLAGLVAKGIMTQELADKIYENVRFEVSRAPAKETVAATAAPAAPAKKDDGGVNF